MPWRWSGIRARLPESAPTGTSKDTLANTQVYLDGVRVYQGSQPFWPTAFANTQVGTGCWGRNWLGYVDELLIFQRQLSDAQALARITLTDGGATDRARLDYGAREANRRTWSRNGGHGRAIKLNDEGRPQRSPSPPLDRG